LLNRGYRYPVREIVCIDVKARHELVDVRDRSTNHKAVQCSNGVYDLGLGSLERRLADPAFAGGRRQLDKHPSGSSGDLDQPSGDLRHRRRSAHPSAPVFNRLVTAQEREP
jgi:hypothetical protein